MTDQKKFEATDDDLPDYILGRCDSVDRGHEPPADADIISRIAAQIYYPTPREVKELETKTQKAIRSSNRDAIGRGPQFIRYAKKHQMFQWLVSLEPQIHTMDSREQDFCWSLLGKFRKYGAQGAKWVTLPQYEWLLRIAAARLDIPKKDKR